jgi:hypothetical protein
VRGYWSQLWIDSVDWIVLGVFEWGRWLIGRLVGSIPGLSVAGRGRGRYCLGCDVAGRLELLGELEGLFENGDGILGGFLGCGLWGLEVAKQSEGFTIVE